MFNFFECTFFWYFSIANYVAWGRGSMIDILVSWQQVKVGEILLYYI